ncbi:AI-2E family transporter [Rhizobium sp. SSA_523]|uniref:AI-2E family transporter n=1 Tax=Rhizobium sp. SSA_523 TaxID=2952477 RepID=UPI0020915F36|nr:AI-2E family transporter [Rhizobium sp. SSA_523]MCO5732534.1 AI-2E family transporter [Rhizobium sp. SSA_523]WKC22327.1 AI-2E family transporter [Rhizobium sp. SSA_523]
MSRARISVIVLLVLLVLLMVAAPSMLLLTFAGLLFAILLNAGGSYVARWTGLGDRTGVLAFTFMIFATLIVLGFWFAPAVGEQIDQLSDAVPKAIARLETWLSHYQWGQDMISRLSVEDLLTGSLRSTATSAVTTTFGGLGNIVIILFIGLYGALEPQIYQRGLLALLPPSARARGEDVLQKSVSRLRHWLKAQFLSMTAVGLLTALGLWAIGLPLPLLLGLMAALLAFIPNIGPILACLPALSLALPSGMTMVIWVLIVYTAVQTAESYFLTPLIQRHEVHLPPALILSVQILLAALFGILGLALATPLTALAIVLVREIYVRDYLRGGEAPVEEA